MARQREWEPSTRKPWNDKIHNLLTTIDLHTELHIKTGDTFHIEQAEILRNYIKSLKTWIHLQEKNGIT